MSCGTSKIHTNQSEAIMRNITALVIVAIAILAVITILVIDGFEPSGTVAGLASSLAALVGALILIFKQNPDGAPPDPPSGK